MEPIKTRPLFRMPMQVERRVLGTTPLGARIHVAVTEARIESPDLNARLVCGGDDWVIESPDGTLRMDCRLMFETDDGSLIGMTYRGLRHTPPEAAQRQAGAETDDPDPIYHRVAILFETAAPRYAHLNNMLALGRARRGASGAVYEIFEVL